MSAKDKSMIKAQQNGGARLHAKNARKSRMNEALTITFSFGGKSDARSSSKTQKEAELQDGEADVQSSASGKTIKKQNEQTTPASQSEDKDGNKAATTKDVDFPKLRPPVPAQYWYSGVRSGKSFVYVPDDARPADLCRCTSAALQQEHGEAITSANTSRYDHEKYHQNTAKALSSMSAAATSWSERTILKRLFCSKLDFEDCLQSGAQPDGGSCRLGADSDKALFLAENRKMRFPYVGGQEQEEEASTSFFQSSLKEKENLATTVHAEVEQFCLRSALLWSRSTTRLQHLTGSTGVFRSAFSQGLAALVHLEVEDKVTNEQKQDNHLLVVRPGATSLVAADVLALPREWFSAGHVFGDTPRGDVEDKRGTKMKMIRVYQYQLTLSNKEALSQQARVESNEIQQNVLEEYPHDVAQPGLFSEEALESALGSHMSDLHLALDGGDRISKSDLRESLQSRLREELSVLNMRNGLANDGDPIEVSYEDVESRDYKPDAKIGKVDEVGRSSSAAAVSALSAVSTKTSPRFSQPRRQIPSVLFLEEGNLNHLQDSGESSQENPEQHQEQMIRGELSVVLDMSDFCSLLHPSTNDITETSITTPGGEAITLSNRPIVSADLLQEELAAFVRPVVREATRVSLYEATGLRTALVETNKKPIFTGCSTTRTQESSTTRASSSTGQESQSSNTKDSAFSSSSRSNLMLTLSAEFVAAGAGKRRRRTSSTFGRTKAVSLQKGEEKNYDSKSNAYALLLGKPFETAVKRRVSDGTSIAVLSSKVVQLRTFDGKHVPDEKEKVNRKEDEKDTTTPANTNPDSSNSFSSETGVEFMKMASPTTTPTHNTGEAQRKASLLYEIRKTTDVDDVEEEAPEGELVLEDMLRGQITVGIVYDSSSDTISSVTERTAVQDAIRDGIAEATGFSNDVVTLSSVFEEAAPIASSSFIGPERETGPLVQQEHDYQHFTFSSRRGPRGAESSQQSRRRKRVRRRALQPPQQSTAVLKTTRRRLSAGHAAKSPTGLLGAKRVVAKGSTILVVEYVISIPETMPPDQITQRLVALQDATAVSEAIDAALRFRLVSAPGVTEVVSIAVGEIVAETKNIINQREETEGVLTEAEATAHIAAAFRIDVNIPNLENLSTNELESIARGLQGPVQQDILGEYLRLVAEHPTLLSGMKDQMRVTSEIAIPLVPPSSSSTNLLQNTVDGRDTNRNALAKAGTTIGVFSSGDVSSSSSLVSSTLSEDSSDESSKSMQARAKARHQILRKEEPPKSPASSSLVSSSREEDTDEASASTLSHMEVAYRLSWPPQDSASSSSGSSSTTNSSGSGPPDDATVAHVLNTFTREENFNTALGSTLVQSVNSFADEVEALQASFVDSSVGSASDMTY
ncbi:unnamed protein product [Amoebophrya sp. A25]|nr:unnamed protein product [Amoebophrya sp. A25]|eukprot:GSA25T00025097001.1